jgi:uncharacterized repeat protein (TIGR04076 family)
MSETGTPIHVEIVRILEGGECPMGLEIGQTWIIADGHVPEGMCASAWHSIEPFVTSIRFGGTFPWSGTQDIELTCPDAANPVVFRARPLEDVE